MCFLDGEASLVSMKVVLFRVHPSLCDVDNMEEMNN